MSGNKYNRCKTGILSYMAVLALFFTSCQSPDELLPSVAKKGINSITATFEDGQGEFFGTPNENNEIVINIPYYFPEESDNVVTTDMLKKMRVTANLDNNVKLSPKLHYLDLTLSNEIEIVDQLKKRHKFVVTSAIKKSEKCSIEEFSLPESNLYGVINNKESVISLVTMDDLAPQVAAIRISPHATIEPDPRVTELNYNEPVELVVTAHDGTTKQVYKVVKNVPSKLEFGIRKGSEKLLFAKKLRDDLGITTENLTGGIAYSNGNLIINTRAQNSIYIDAKTGAKMGEIELGAVKGNLINFYNTSDEQGNILISNLTSDGAFRLWTLGSVTSSPELFIEWETTNSLGRKVSIKGDVTKNAIISAPIFAAQGTSNQFAQWIVSNGILESQIPNILTVSGLDRGWTTNADIIYSSATDASSDYYVASYSDNTFAWVNGQTNQVRAKLDEIDRNYIQNAVDYLEFNNAKFATLNHVNSFNWGSADQVWLLNVSDLSTFSGNLSDGSAKNIVWASPKDKYGPKALTPIYVNGNGTGDVLMTKSEDGYYLYLYFMFTNGYVVGYQFDCMDI